MRIPADDHQRVNLVDVQATEVDKEYLSHGPLADLHRPGFLLKHVNLQFRHYSVAMLAKGYQIVIFVFMRFLASQIGFVVYL